MAAEALDEGHDIVGVPVWRVGQLIDRRPGSAGGNAWIPRDQVLMEVRVTQTDHGHVHAVCAFGT
jgi:hypothetical protein